MATTTNYGWETPDDTDLVKDGALAMRTTANSIDSTLGTALNNKLHAGLVLVKTQTVGSGVSSVTVTGAFNSTYDNYRISYIGGSSSIANGDISMRLGSTATGYNYNLIFTAYNTTTVSAVSGQNVTSWVYVGSISSSGNMIDIDVYNPFATSRTFYKGQYVSAVNGASAGSLQGVLTDATSYTAFTLTPSSGTLTGGTIAVYGYAKD